MLNEREKLRKQRIIGYYPGENSWPAAFTTRTDTSKGVCLT